LERVGGLGMYGGVHGSGSPRLAVIAADADHIMHLTADATGRQLPGPGENPRIRDEPWWDSQPKRRGFFLQ
jgi:hypothetical protein